MGRTKLPHGPQVGKPWCIVSCVDSHIGFMSLAFKKEAVIIEKINFRQNKTKPCIAEPGLRSTQVYHVFLTCAV